LKHHLESTSIEDILASFSAYKGKVPVCGCIILNPEMDKVLLVKGWSNRSSWGFPKGKINKDEPEIVCAAREVYEETSLEVQDQLKEEDSLEVTLKEQKLKMYIVAGIPENTQFVPRTRKEISVRNLVKIEIHHNHCYTREILIIIRKLNGCQFTSCQLHS
jgi:8-oxo-dGTP pyrophosphatase MutT (NUDIX family)